MSKDERDFLDDLRAKSIEAAAEIMESLQRLKLLYEEITDDGSGGTLPRPRPADFFYRLARFELEHASNIIRLGNSQAEMIFDHVRQLARRSKGGAVPTSVVALELTTVDGKDAYRGSFEIKNPFATESDARWEVSELRDASGDKQSATVKIECGNGRVAAHQTARVDVTVAKSAVKDQTLFGEVTVYLSADVERQVARRAIKVRPA